MGGWRNPPLLLFQSIIRDVEITAACFHLNTFLSQQSLQHFVELHKCCPKVNDRAVCLCQTPAFILNIPAFKVAAVQDGFFSLARTLPGWPPSATRPVDEQGNALQRGIPPPRFIHLKFGRDKYTRHTSVYEQHSNYKNYKKLLWSELCPDVNIQIMWLYAEKKHTRLSKANIQFKC